MWLLRKLLGLLKAKPAPPSLPETPMTQPAPMAQSAAATVQFMVTKKMRRELTDLGWKKDQIDKLSPDAAAHAISLNQSPN